MKGKKILALLLSVLLVVGMLPMSAMAATQTGSGANNVFFDITVSNTFGGTVGTSNDAFETDSTASLTESVSDCYTGPGRNVNAANESTYVTQTKANIANANALYKGETEVTAGATDTVYVGIKFRLQNQDGTRAGVTMANAMITFPKDVFEYDENEPAIVNPVQVNETWGGMSLTNMKKLSADTQKKYWSGAGRTDFTAGEMTATLVGPVSGDASSATAEAAANIGVVNVYLANTTTDSFALSEETTWDIVLPLKVKADAPSSTTGYKIGLQKYLQTTSGSGSSAFQVSKATWDGNTPLTGSSDIESYNIGSASERDSMIGMSEATVKITGPAIELKGAPKVVSKTGQKVTVTPSGGFAPAEGGKWLICEAGQTTGVAATAVQKGDDYELTFDATSLKTDNTTEYIVVYQKDATTLKTEGKFKVLAAMKGTASITETSPKFGDTLHATLSSGSGEPTTGLTYQWYRGNTAISGATSSTYTTVAADVGQAISVAIGATGFDGMTDKSSAVTIAKKDGPTLSNGSVVGTKVYNTTVTAAELATALNTANSGLNATANDLVIGNVDGTVLTKSGNTITVAKGTGSGTVQVGVKESATTEASQNNATITVTAAKKDVTLASASGSAGDGVEFTLPGLNGTVAGNVPTITWTEGSPKANIASSTLANGKITATLTDNTQDGTIPLTAAITSDDYQLKTTSYTLTVTAAAMTNIVLDAAATTAGFTVSPASVVQGTSNNEITITPPADYTIDSVTGTGVTWTSGNKFTLSTTEGQASVTVTITGHAAKTVTATITSKPYDGTVAIDKSDVTFNVAGVTFEKAEYEDANVGTNKVVTITGITWPDTTNEYTLADVKGDITAVTPASAAAAATAVANTNPTTANVIEAIKAAVITFTNADGKTFTMTVGSLLADATTDTVLESKIADAINGVAAFESTKAPDNTKTYDASVDGTAAATVNPGSVISVAEGKHIEGNVYTIDSQKDAASADVTYFSVDAATGAITIASDAPVGVYTVVIKGGEAASAASEGMKEAATPVTITATITVEACGKEYKLENLAENATGEINLGNIYSLLDATKSPNLSGLPATIELSLNVTKSNTPAPGPSTSFKPYMDGFEDGTLLPGKSVTRAQFAKMLVIATGKYDETKKYEKPDYSDVIEGKWYVPFIACAVENKIMSGYEDGKIYPNRTITRQEAAKMIYVALGTTEEIKTTDKVKDFDKVSNWAKTYVATLVEKNIIKGFDDGTFKPTNKITRAQTAVMINRLLGFDPTDEQKAEIAKLTIENQFPDVTPSTNWSYAHLMYASGKLPDSYYGK